MQHGGRFSGDVKKTFDKRLLKKALRFSYPYWYLAFDRHWCLCCLFTAADIYRPILEGDGIDKFMQGAVDGKLTVARSTRRGCKDLGVIYLWLIIICSLWWE